MTRMIIIYLFAVIICLYPGTLFAQENEENSGPPLIVEPLYPDNQVDNIRGYFRMNVEPEQEQTLNVKLTNNLDAELTVRIEGANAYTNPTGEILYGKDIESEKTTLLNDAIQLERYITVRPEITLAPNESQEVPVEIVVPDTNEGTILGGIRFITGGTDENNVEEAGEDEANFILKTETVHAVAIQLDLPNKTEPRFELGNADFTPEGPSVYIEMINNAQMIQEDITAEYTVEDGEGNQLFEGTTNTFKMAPKTQIRYPLSWDYETLEEGDYQVYVKANVNNNEIVAEEEFTIGDDAIDDYVERTQPTVNRDTDEAGFPTWILYVIGGALIAGTMYLIGRRKGQGT
ncbi:DUF916 domain-containing protein [Oceanobacillus halotolerans]|uniref:DUF916 domain-containing protein n=1 Tax=Oceanobacillus halotolerans TaxID=2663380 RepID=UPI0013DA1FC4|nr:DUF916 domain-containing protein [Oceanobacillus halotolerans]